MALSILRLLSASLMIFVTTADDAIWLIPYLNTKKIGVMEAAVHALVFLAALESTIFMACLAVMFFGDTMRSTNVIFIGLSVETLLQVIAALVCWCIAAALFAKKCLKQRRRNKQALALALARANDNDNRHRVVVDYSSISISDKENDESAMEMETSHGRADIVTEEEDDSSSSFSSTRLSWASIRTVSLLTVMGSLDEVSYMPSLLLSGTYSPTDLMVGGLIASSCIVVAITVLRGVCSPALAFMDAIPLYAIVAMFATIMTCSLLLE